MDKDEFIEVFEIAFPERPKDKIEKLAEQLANKDGKICEFKTTNYAHIRYEDDFYMNFIILLFSCCEYASSLLSVL